MNTLYQPKNLLITGGCGFIGSHVVNHLVKTRPEIHVYNIDRIDYCSNVKNIVVNDYPNYTFIKGNISNTDLINYILKDHHIDTIMHFAAQTHVDNSFANAMPFIEDNIIATFKLLDSCNKYGKIERFIHVSTDEVYGDIDISIDKCDEDTRLNPTNPYAVSKTCAEYFVRSFYKCHNLPIIITRGNNVFGPNQYPEKVIPKFINQLKQNKKCTIHGEGKNTRNFIYVQDVVTAFERVLFYGEISKIYNIGTDNEFSVLEIAHKLISIMKPGESPENWIEFVEDRKWNDIRYNVCNRRLTNLGWKEETNFEEHLQKTIKWYVENPNFWNS